MNYWLLTTEFPPFFGGGIATYCVNTVRMMAASGYSVTVVTPNAGAGDPYQKEITGTHTIIRFNPHHPKFSKYGGYYAGLSYRFAEVVEQLIASGNVPDIIESQDYQGIGYYVLQFKLLKPGALQKVPVIITLHSPAFLYLDVNRVPLYRFPEYQVCEMEKQSIAAADLVISPTEYMYSELAGKMPMLKSKVKVIANPFATEQQADIDSPYNPNKIIFYGKLSLQKGVMNLLEYFREIWETLNLQLVLIGGTDIVYYPQQRTMGDYVKALYNKYIADGRLIIKDKIPPGELKKEINDANVVVIPSIIDNLPYALLENMALGKIVLASSQGGQSEVITGGENGFLFDHEKQGDFLKKLLFILSMPGAERRRISENAVSSIASGYSFSAIFSQKQKVLEELKRQYKEPAVFPFLYQQQVIALPVEGGGTLLSIVIPYYNMGNYLPEALQSIKNSSYPDYEIIVVNDGSNEPNSLNVLRDAEKYSGCRIISTPNRGLAEARNTGAQNSRGRYLAFLDPDDKIAPDYYAKAIGVLKKYSNVYGVGCLVKYFEQKSSYWITSTPQPPYILAHNSVNSSALVYKRNAFLAAGLNDKKVDYGLEDYESVINMISQGCNIVVMPEVLFYYRVRRNSMFRNINRNKLLYCYKYIAEKHAGYFSLHFVELIHLLNANGPGFLFDSSGIERKVFSLQTMKSIVSKKIPENSVVYRMAKKIFLWLAKK